MFALDAPPRQGVVDALLAAHKDTPRASWTAVPSPSFEEGLAALPPSRQQRASGSSLKITASTLPEGSLLPSLEDVRRAYPAAPPSALVNTASPAANADAEPRARSKRERASPPAQAEEPARPEKSAAGDAGPSAHFEEDYERVDYMGRAFTEPPTALVQSAAASMARPCLPPQSLRGVFKEPVSAAAAPSSAASAGVQLVRWAPPAYGHLLFAANLQGVARLWEARGSRRAVADFRAHSQPIKSLELTSRGDVMSTGSVDGTAAVWDVEAGLCKAVLTNPEHQQVVQHCHHPSNEDALVLVAVDRKVALYDLRVSHRKLQREYAGHMGTIFNVTLLSGGAKFLTTAEDRTLRTWDFRIPVQIKQFADANMHAITHVVHHPTEDLLAAQSLDNKVTVFKDEGGGRLRLVRNREFSGHTTSGTRCQLAFSHDGQFLSSGDISGGLYLWRWSTGELVKTFKAHSQMLVSHQWHPLEPSRIVTGGWDGSIKNWV